MSSILDTFSGMLDTMLSGVPEKVHVKAVAMSRKVDYASLMTDSRDAGRALDTVLSYLANRRVTAKEIAKVLGISRSAYYQQRDEDRLITADNLIRAARGLGINEVDLLIRYGLVSQEAAIEYVEALREAQAEAAALDPKLNTRRDDDDELRHRPDTPPL